MNEQIDYLHDCQRLSVNDGDVIVFKSPAVLPQAQIEQIVREMGILFPRNRCIVIDAGCEVGVMAEAAA